LADTDLYAVANRISYVDSEVKNGTTLFLEVCVINGVKLL
jgi:hypothetical protein